MRSQVVCLLTIGSVIACGHASGSTQSTIERMFANASKDHQPLITFSDGTTEWSDGSEVYRLADGAAVIVKSQYLALDTDGADDGLRSCDKDSDRDTSITARNGSPVDSNVTPYIVLPGCHSVKDPEGGSMRKCLTRYSFEKLGLQLGDLAAVVTGNRIAFAIAADVGPEKKFGEGSIELHRELGHETVGRVSAHPGCAANERLDHVTYIVVFPHSNSRWLPNDDIARIGAEHWQKLLLRQGLSKDEMGSASNQNP